MSLDSVALSNQEIGKRLRTIREAQGLRQGYAAEKIRVARTTFVAIEQGKRRVRSEEIQKLARIYGTSVNAILRREAVHLDLTPQFRKLPRSSEQAREDAAQLLTRLVCAEAELENALGIERRVSYPHEKPILPGDVAVQADGDAHELRSWLGLGSGPVLDILSLLELHIGMRVYIRPLNSIISGLFAYTKAAGACVLLNAKHRPGRIAQTAAHELGHLITTREVPELLVEHEAASQSRAERYASAFARSFLTPGRAVRRQFAEITAGSSHLTRRHVILLADAFGVSREAIVRRLEELAIAREGTWDWFQDNGRITDAQAEEVLGRPLKTERMRGLGQGPVPQRLGLLIREASKRELYSEGQLASLLALDRRAVRQILDGVEQEKSEAVAFVELPP